MRNSPITPAPPTPPVASLTEAVLYINELSRTFMYFNALVVQADEKFLIEKAAGAGTVALLCNWALITRVHGLRYGLRYEPLSLSFKGRSYRRVKTTN